MGSKLAFCLILFGTSYLKDGGKSCQSSALIKFESIIVSLSLLAVALQCHECSPSLNGHKCEDDTWTTNNCGNGNDACIWSWTGELMLGQAIYVSCIAYFHLFRWRQWRAHQDLWHEGSGGQLQRECRGRSVRLWLWGPLQQQIHGKVEWTFHCGICL